MEILKSKLTQFLWFLLGGSIFCLFSELKILLINYITKDFETRPCYTVDNLATPQTLSFSSLIMFIIIFSLISSLFITLKFFQAKKRDNLVALLAGCIISIVFFEGLPFLEFVFGSKNLNFSSNELFIFVGAYLSLKLLRNKGFKVDTVRYFIISFILSFMIWANQIYNKQFMGTINNIFFYPENLQNFSINMFPYYGTCSGVQPMLISMSIIYIFIILLLSGLLTISINYFLNKNR